MQDLANLVKDGNADLHKVRFWTLSFTCHINTINAHKVYGVIPEIKDYIFPNGLDVGEWGRHVYSLHTYVQIEIWTNHGRSMTTTPNRIYFTLVSTVTWYLHVQIMWAVETSFHFVILLARRYNRWSSLNPSSIHCLSCPTKIAIYVLWVVVP